MNARLPRPAVAVAAVAVPMLLCTALAGCGAADPGTPGDPVDPGPGTAAPVTLRDRLAAGAALEVAAPTSDVELTARLLSVEEVPPPRRLEVIDGTVALHTSVDALVLEAIDVTFEDLELSAEEFPPDGLHLTGLRVVLPAPIEATAYWSPGGAELVAAPMAAVTMEWSVVAENGTVVPLAPQTFAEMPVDLRVWIAGDGALALAVDGAAPGAFWSWAGLVEMSDLTFSLAAAEAGAPAS